MSGSTLPDIERELQDLLEVVERAGISTFTSPADAGVELESADEFIARMHAIEAGALDLLAARRRSRLRRMALAASSVAAAGVLAVTVFAPGGTAPAAQASTPALLDYEFANARDLAYAPGKDTASTFQQLAASAATQKTTRGADQLVVIDEWQASVDDLSKETVLTPQLTEFTLRADGSTKLVERKGNTLSADGRGLPDAKSWSAFPAVNTEELPAGELDPKLASNLPTSVEKLRSALLELSDCQFTERTADRAYCLYEQAISIQRQYVLSPQLTTAIWKVLGGEEGFSLLGAVEDRVGRDGVGISLIAPSQPQFRYVVIADPETGKILGTEQILVKKQKGWDVDAPAIISFTAIIESRYTN